MKGILVFDLNDTGEAERFRVASKAQDWYLVCLELDRELRNIVKYDDVGVFKAEAFEEIRTMLHELMAIYRVSLDDMS